MNDPQELVTELRAPATDWRKSVLRWLAFIGGIITVILGALAYAELLPAKYAGIAASVVVVLMSCKDGIIAIGDRLDDGQANNSFKLSYEQALSAVRNLPQETHH